LSESAEELKGLQKKGDELTFSNIFNIKKKNVDTKFAYNIKNLKLFSKDLDTKGLPEGLLKLLTPVKNLNINNIVRTNRHKKRVEGAVSYTKQGNELKIKLIVANKSYGKELLIELVKLNPNVNKIKLDAINNVKVIEFYKKHGFKVIKDEGNTISMEANAPFRF
jgi:hypothetical protein